MPTKLQKAPKMNAHRKQADLARALMTKEETIALSRKRPGRVYADLALLYTMMLGAIMLLRFDTGLAVQILALIIIGTRQYALFIIGHDGIHKNLHPRAGVNDRLTRWLIFAPLGMVLNTGRVSHLGHHRLLGSNEDPDRYLHAAENKSTKLQFFLFLTGLATFFKTVWKVTRTVDSSNGETQRTRGTIHALRSFVAPRIPTIIAQTLIFVGFAAAGSWWWYLTFWVAPIYFFVFVPDEIRAFCDHAHPIVPDEDADDIRLITYAPPILERLVFSPMNMNFHAEHHLWPYVPYYNLPRAHQLLRARADGRVIIRPGYLTFLRNYSRALPLIMAQGRKRVWRPMPDTSRHEVHA